MYAWDRDGAPLSGWPVQVGDQIISSAALADLDSDGLPDVVAGSKDHRLYRLEQPGGRYWPAFRWIWALMYSHRPGWATWRRDRTRLTKAMEGGRRGRREQWHPPPAKCGPLGERVWPCFHRDERRSGAVGQASRSRSGTGTAIP